MALTAHDIANTLLTVGFVLMWVFNGYIWYLICTDDLLGHIDNLFGWISTVTMLCSAVSGLLTLCYLALGSRILAYLKARDDVQADADDGKEEGEDIE